MRNKKESPVRLCQRCKIKKPKKYFHDMESYDQRNFLNSLTLDPNKHRRSKNKNTFLKALKE